MKKLIFIVANLLLVVPCAARIITVDNNGPADFNNIQAAINDANDGDTVLVADGIYKGPGNRDIYFGGKAITVRSENGPNNCIIDCNGSETEPHDGFSFWLDDVNPVLAGFTITNGYALYKGGGISCWACDPCISDCIITGNVGGGIYCQDQSSPTITNCTISNNSGSGIMAWGIFGHVNLTVTGCTFTGNTSTLGGGAIYCRYGDLTATDCIFIGNSATNNGGAIYANEDTTISNCRIIGNKTRNGAFGNGHAGDGGGIYAAGSLRINNSIIRDNETGDGGVDSNWSFAGDGGSGGGVYCTASMIIKNCTIVNNTTGKGGTFGEFNGDGGHGGGVYCSTSSPWWISISDSNISGNKTGGSAEPRGLWPTLSGRGGGIYCTSPKPLKISGCVITNNRTGDGASSEYETSDGGDGGGIYCNSANISNCTIYANITGTGGDANGSRGIGAGVYADANTMVTNSIIWDNEPDQLFGLDCNDVNYCDIADGVCSSGTGNINVDPCFVDPGYWVDANDPNIIVEPNDPNAIWLDGDYHLLPISPCINAGDPNYVPEPNETDLDGNPRIDGGRIDMGAYETVMHQARLWIRPRVINRKSHRPKWITAWMYLPAGISKEQVDKDTPLTLYPGGIKAARQFVLRSRRRFDKRTRVLAFFNRDEFLDAVDTNGLVQLQVFGFLLEPGQYFHGSDRIIIINPRPRRRWWWHRWRR